MNNSNEQSVQYLGERDCVIREEEKRNYIPFVSPYGEFKKEELERQSSFFQTLTPQYTAMPWDVKRDIPTFPTSYRGMGLARKTLPDCVLKALDFKETMLNPKKVLVNGDYTTIVWNDKEVTMVKRKDGDPHDEYAAFCQAVVKRLYGSTSKAKKAMEKVRKVKRPKKKKENQEEPPRPWTPEDELPLT